MAIQLRRRRAMTTTAALGARPAPLMAPREHGAWAMLALPFVSALILAGRLAWEVIPAAVVVVGIFLVREPLVTLWRQMRVWKEHRPESEQAWRSLAWYGPPTAAAGLILLWRLPLWPVLSLSGAALALLAVSTFLIVQNRQRSLLLQLASAAGLTASALLAWLAVRPALEMVAVWLWVLQYAHSAAALLAVRARLEARIASRGNGQAGVMRNRAAWAQGALLAGAAACAATGHLGVAAALAASGGIHTADLMRLRKPAFLQVPLRCVGLRELALSVIFSALVVFGLG